MSREPPESESGPDETVHVFRTVLLVTYQEAVAKTGISAFPMRQNSRRKAGEEIFVDKISQNDGSYT